MTVVTQPNLVEVSDFRGGWSPDGENATTEPDILLDVMNLVPDVNTGSLVTRKGFARLTEQLLGEGDGHYIKQVFNMATGGGNHFLIAVLTNEMDEANNVRLFAAKFPDLDWQRIDDAGTTWTQPKSNHWGEAVDEIWYGGSRTNEMYSWDYTGWDFATSNNGTWDATAATGSWKTWVNARNDSVTTSTQYGKDFAWTGKEKVTYSGDTYTPNVSIRYDDWETAIRYTKGEKISRKTTWASTSSYYKSFKCTETHTSSSTNAPGTGSATDSYWSPIQIPAPIDDDSETHNKWNFVPIAAETDIAVWHANRMFMRYDDQGDKSRVLFSAPVKPQKNQDVPDVIWRPTDFAPSTQNDGAGGGWLPFNEGRMSGPVEALHSFGQYLVVLKRRHVYVLSGTDDATWTTRELAGGIGTVGPMAKAEMNNLLYFLDESGLYVTDGTSVEKAPGFEKTTVYLKDRLDGCMTNGQNKDPQMWAYDGFLWISLPDSTSDEPDVTLVYEPSSESWWKTDLPVQNAVLYRQGGEQRMAFSSTETHSRENLLYLYNSPDNPGTDDRGTQNQKESPTEWSMTTAWWPFGVAREQRRIRRTWAVVRGPADFTLSAFRNYDETGSVESVTRTVLDTTPVHVEGSWFADSHAVQFKLEGEGDVGIFGVAVDTQPRRIRYHH